MKRIGNNWIIYLYVMFIAPLFALIMGLFDRSLGGNSKKWLVIFFITFLGSLLTFENKKGDAYTYQMMVKDHYTNKTFSEFVSDSYKIITLQGAEYTKGDIYFHFLGYFVGSMLQMPGLLFVFVAYIYAFFYIGSVYKVLELTRGRPWSALAIVFLLAFIAWKTIHDMQTIRTWTGLWVMVYGALSYFESGRIKYLGFLALPPLIHFGYFLMVLPAWMVVLLGNRKMLYAALFLVSFFTYLIPEQWALKQFQKFPLGAQKVEGYHVSSEQRNEDQDLGGKKPDDIRFYKTYVKSGAHKWGYVLSTIVLIFSGGYFFYMNFLESCLFSIGLLAKALSNASFFIFALSNRADAIAAIFVLSGIVIFLFREKSWLNNKGIKTKLVKIGLWSAFLLILPLFIFKLAGLLGWASFFLIFFPFIPWLTEVNFTIRDVILYFL